MNPKFELDGKKSCFCLYKSLARTGSATVRAGLSQEFPHVDEFIWENYNDYSRD